MFDGQTQSSYGEGNPIDMKDKNIYLKFYSDGKVGKFHQLDVINLETMNPKNSSIGYYCSNLNENSISFIYHHVQSGVRISKFKFKTSNDTLIVYSLEKYTNNPMNLTYVKKQIDPALLVYRPDW